MNKFSILVLSALFLSACDGSGTAPNSTENTPFAASPVTNPIGASPSAASNSDILVRGISTIEGEITLHNNPGATSDVEVNVSVRDSEAGTTMQPDGSFELEIPLSDIAQTVILDFEGPNVVPATVSLAIPAEADRVSVDANIAVRTPSITFSLDSGGVMTNSLRLNDISARNLTPETTCEEAKLAVETAVDAEKEAEKIAASTEIKNQEDLDAVKAALEEADANTEIAQKEAANACAIDTRVTVEIPPSAFEFADGTLATGAGEVSITEINIEDLAGSGSWAPNLVGLAEQASEEGALTTLGMTDFYFSQGGEQLQLRPGMNATISTDMLTTVVIPKGETAATQVAAGMQIPLWYYDTVDMVWKEEGQSTVIADNNSPTGFTLSGDVSHFSTWNHDFIVPWTTIGVTVELVDVNGQPYTALSVASHTLVASIETVQGTYGNGTPWSYPSNWVNTKNIAGNHSNAYMVAGNLSGNAAVTASAFNAGSTTMTFAASNIVTSGTGSGTLQSTSTTETKTFNNNDSDRTIILEVVVEEDPNNPSTSVPATIIIELIDLEGNVRDDINVTGYRVTAQSDQFPIWQDQTNLTPTDNIIAIEDITQEQVDNGQTVTYEFTLDNLFIEGLGEFDLLFPVSETQEITSVDGTYTITLQVPVIDL